MPPHTDRESAPTRRGSLLAADLGGVATGGGGGPSCRGLCGLWRAREGSGLTHMAASGLVLWDPGLVTNIELSNESRPNVESATLVFYNMVLL